MFKEHEQVVLTAPTRNDDGELMRPGDVGVIVHVHPNYEAYVVEYFGINGETVSTGTTLPTQIRPVNALDVLHARRVTYSLTAGSRKGSASPVFSFSASLGGVERPSGRIVAEEGNVRRRVLMMYWRNRLTRPGQARRSRGRSKRGKLLARAQAHLYRRAMSNAVG